MLRRVRSSFVPRLRRSYAALRLPFLRRSKARVLLAFRPTRYPTPYEGEKRASQFSGSSSSTAPARNHPASDAATSCALAQIAAAAFRSRETLGIRNARFSGLTSAGSAACAPTHRQCSGARLATGLLGCSSTRTGFAPVGRLLRVSGHRSHPPRGPVFTGRTPCPCPCPAISRTVRLRAVVHRSN